MQQPTLIHLFADFSAASPEHTIYSALLAQKFPGVGTVFSYQNFKPGESIPPAVFLKLVKNDFPPGTFHFCLLHIEERFREKYILAECDGAWFFGPDNGILPMVLEDLEPVYYKLNEVQNSPDIMRQIYLPAAELLKSNPDGRAHFEVEVNPVKLLVPAPTKSGDTVRLTVLYTDATGNAYLNINKSEFERLVADKPFRLRLGYRDNIDTLNQSILEVPMGQKVAFFGLGNLLQIAINCGSAEQLLGLIKNKPVLLQIE